VFTVAECVISWKAELQETIALSTTESEFMAAVEASKEALWLRVLVETLSIIQDSVWIHYDNQRAIHLAKDLRYHKRTKHITVRFHKWVVDDKVINLIKISTKKNPADMMMKDHPGEEVQSTFELPQGSPKIK